MKRALDAALDYLSRRSLTYYELKTKLDRKGYSEEEIQEAMERVESWGYINDRALALSVAQAKLEDHSRQRVEHELRKRGIPSSVIVDVFAETYQPEQELTQCFELAQKLWAQEARRWETIGQYKKTYAKIPRTLFLKQKVGQKLAQKGYPAELIHPVLDRISHELP